MIDLTYLPALNAILNTVCAVCLGLGYYHIRRGNPAVHKRFMITAVIVSMFFFCSYAIYHMNVGSVKYPYHDWTRVLYFVILIPHVILATVMLPFIVVTLWFAFHENFNKHRRFAVWVLPVWMFVSVSGVLVYLMLYR